MNSKYIVRQPIKDLSGKLLGYQIQYYGENESYNTDMDSSPNEYIAADTIYNFLTQNSEKVLRGSLNFMTFTTTLLLKQTPKLFRPDDLVIQIDDSVLIHPLAMHFVERFAQEGYKIAINDFRFSPRYLSVTDYIDYIKINFHTMSDSNIRNIVDMAHSLKKKCIATGVDDESLYQKAFVMNMDAMEGNWVAERLFSVVHGNTYLQSNFFRLMVVISEDTPDMDEIERIIATDAMLTYNLLKIVNSGYYALRNRATDVRQAVMVMGLAQLRQWIYLFSVGNGNEPLSPSQEEFLRLSLTRAIFCSKLMQYCSNMPITRNDAYLMGMFSTLNYLIAAPLEVILAELPILQEVKDALLEHKGRCGTLYDVVLSYERADWKSLEENAEILGIPMNQLSTIYFQCLDEVNGLWIQLSDMNRVTSTSAKTE